jgi:GPH family glycoside/pentoside/hexuronide:cation symporter
MHDLVPATTWLGFINIISIVLFCGRAFDSIIDPFLANLSDKSTNKLGRRIPFMRYSFIPLSIFYALIFLPMYGSPHGFNIAWLAVTQLIFYFFYGMYTISYNALLADMSTDDKTKLNLSTAQSVGFMLGILFASSTTVTTKLFMNIGLTHDRLVAYQYSIIALNLIAMVCLGVAAFLIDEKKYAQPAKYSGGVFTNLKTTLKNGNFRIFILADMFYFMAIAIIGAGLLYYLKAMLKLDEAVGGAFMLGMVIITLAFYTLVHWLSPRSVRKK